MSQDTCVTRNKLVGYDYTDEVQKMGCLEVTECGISLAGVPRNEETERFFAAAEKTGLPEILSMDDAKAIGSTSRFLDDARAYLEKLRSQDPLPLLMEMTPQRFNHFE